MKKKDARKNKKSSATTKFLFVVFAFFIFSLSASFFPPHDISFSAAIASDPEDTRGDLQGGYDTSPLTQQEKAAIIANSESFCKLLDYKCVLKSLLISLLKVLAWLLSAAASLFLWVILPENFSTIATGANIYAVWQTVRDLLNIAFILVLLYSAFCQIFQVEKYSFKKIWLNFILMALLVNFSFPITRFIIDASNVLMYTILNALVPTANGSLVATFAEASHLKGILAAGPASASWASLIAAIIFTFIMAVTLLGVAVLFLIRMITLAILIVFSPVAFVATIVSGGEGASSKWWNYLFSNAFFGPAMALMLFVATKLMDATSQTYSTMVAASQKNEALDPGIVGAMGMFAVPIVVLWIGMGTAKTMGAFGASEVMGQAQKFIGWAGKKFSGYNAIKDQYTAFAGARKKRAEEKNKARFGASLGNWANKAQDTIIATPSAKKRLEEMERKKVQEIRDDWKKSGGVSNDDVFKALESLDSAKRKAAALEMAEKNGFGDGTDNEADLARYRQARNAVAGDKVSEKTFNDKVEEKHIRLVIAYETPTKGIAAAYHDNLKDMNADALSKQRNLLDKDEFHDNFLLAKKSGPNADPEFIKEVAKKVSNDVRLDWKRTAPNRGYSI